MIVGAAVANVAAAFRPVLRNAPSTRGGQVVGICKALQQRSKKQRLSTRLHSAVDSRRDERFQPIGKLSADTNEAVPSTWSKAVQRFFLGDVGPPLVVLSISGFIYTRLQLPQPISIMDATIFFAIVMVWWVQEYFFHRVLLHSSQDWIGKNIHNEHHKKDYFHVSIDPPALLLGWLFAAHVLLKSFMPWHLCLTATVGYAIAGLFYEWSHYIVHTKVKAPVISPDKPFAGVFSAFAAKLFTQMRDNHIRHHRVDDSYWYAFSIPAMDDAFGTNPDIKELKPKTK